MGSQSNTGTSASAQTLGHAADCASGESGIDLTSQSPTPTMTLNNTTAPGPIGAGESSVGASPTVLSTTTPSDGRDTNNYDATTNDNRSAQMTSSPNTHQLGPVQPLPTCEARLGDEPIRNMSSTEESGTDNVAGHDPATYTAPLPGSQCTTGVAAPSARSSRKRKRTVDQVTQGAHVRNV